MTPNCDEIHRFCLAVERMRVMSTPTAIAVARKILINDGEVSKVGSQKDPILSDRSIRRTIKRMSKLGLVRYEKWSRSGEMSLTDTGKKMLRASGFNC